MLYKCLFIFSKSFIQVRVDLDPESILGTLSLMSGIHPGWTPIHRTHNVHSHPANLPNYMIFGGGRKLENWEEPTQTQGEHGKLQTDSTPS